jgi:acyl-coenzyme A synthetase/AMP-(fatty) acid ligase
MWALLGALTAVVAVFVFVLGVGGQDARSCGGGRFADGLSGRNRPDELLGAVANKVNPDFRLRELEFILNFSGSRAYVFPTEFRGFDYADMARTLQAKCPNLARVFSDVEIRTGTEASPPIRDPARMDPDEIFRMAFTSGTTGDPKCVLHSFNTTLYASRLLNADMRVTEKDVLLIYLPMGLNWGYLTLLQTVLAGARAVLLERSEARTQLRVCDPATGEVSLVARVPHPASVQIHEWG